MTQWGGLPGEIVQLVRERAGLAGARSGSIKVIFAVLVRTPPGLRRGCPRLRGARALSQDTELARCVMYDIPWSFPVCLNAVRS